MTDNPETNVTPFAPRAAKPGFTPVPDELALPSGKPYPEAVEILTDMLAMARKGQLRAVSIVVVTEAEPSDSADATPDQCTVSRYSIAHPKYNYAAYAAARRLVMRLEDDILQ